MNANGYIVDRDLRAARELLRWSQRDLAESSKASLPTIRRFETGKAISDEKKDALVECLSKAGVVFFGHATIEGVDVARGVALRPSAKPKGLPDKRIYPPRTKKPLVEKKKKAPIE